ncbi:uncharacterized protein BJX67DRAFT_377485 [Aspergillus lucknowensis]|uniref:FAD-binding domain-containing protein n=1 Tax=Aspergillus lucknowensis TaxID=176173 RepID=A0ABR4M573_9EURO
MASPSHPLNVAVIGGGFAGLSLLIGLQKYSHINAHVYESGSKFSELGAGAVLGPNSQRAMKLIDPRIHEGFERRAAFDPEDADENGRYPWVTVSKGEEPDLGVRVVDYRHEIRGSTIHRAHFLEELVQLVEPHRAHFGQRLVKIQENGDDAPVTLYFRDGTTATADLVVGADGIHSVTRKHLLGEHPAASAFFTGAIIHRATVPLAAAEAKLGDVRNNFGIQCGKDGLVFGFPMAERSLYYLGITTFNNDPVPEDKWVLPVDVAKLRRTFANYGDYVRKQVALVPDDGSAMGWSIWEMPPAPTYYRGRVVLMGDAAHASTPFQGAGAGQAIEDALVLERLLGKYLDTTQKTIYRFSPSETIQLVFQAYDTVRRFRTQKVVTTSAEAGRVLSGNEPGATMEAADIRERRKDRLNWIWNCDQRQQVKDAFQIFEEAQFAAARREVGRGSKRASRL